MQNPLLQAHTLPPFTEIKAVDIEPAITQLIDHNLKAILELVAKPMTPTWENLIAPIEAWDDQLNQAWSPISHLNSVASTPEIRDAHHHCLPKLSDYGMQLGQNEKLYNAYLALKEGPTFAQLSTAQQKVIDLALRDFTLSGIALPADKRKRFADINQELSKLQSKFQDNVTDATDHWHYDVTNEADLAGIPAQAKASAFAAAEKANVTGWRLTLDFPCYHSVITFADNRNLRQIIHEAYSTRASDLGPDAGKWDNTALMQQILTLRYEMAQLLGFNNYSERSLAKKMANTPEQVLSFLQDIAEKAKPFAKKEMDELRSFAKKEYAVDELAPWDIAYYSEKLQQNKYDLSDEMLRPYFPAQCAIAGLFEVVRRLYGLKITEKKGISTWNSDVQFFEVRDHNDELRGMFYLDLFARNHKRGGAWMDEARVRRRLPDGTIQLPVAYLTCNFGAPTKALPALLTHDEVLTLFHEFGHGLHHLLTKIDVAGVSGINGVLWDAVELPSQFMENWCWQEEALSFISKHYLTNEPLPGALLQKMQDAKNFQSAMQLLRQCEFSIFDFRLHLEFSPEKGGEQIQDILKQVRTQYSVVPVAPYNRFQNSFSHIFGGGYAAGYYSYLWAEVLSSDAFSKFESEGIFNTDTGKAFLQKILEKGGSVDPAILFRDFRGRDPDSSAFLRHRGISG
jgi:oligopeptidase A